VSPSITVQSLPQVKISEARQSLNLARVNLTDLFVHGNGAHNKSAVVIALGQACKALDRFGNVPDPDVKITEGVDQRKVGGILLDQLLILCDRVADLALNDVFVSRL
jgi:hypothetical protein